MTIMIIIITNACSDNANIDEYNTIVNVNNNNNENYKKCAISYSIHVTYCKTPITLYTIMSKT